MLTSNLTFLILSANWSDEIDSLELFTLGLKLITINMLELPKIESFKILVIFEFLYGTWLFPSLIDMIQCPKAVRDLLILINSLSLFLFVGCLLSTKDLSNFSDPAKSTILSLVIVMFSTSENLDRCMSIMFKMQWLRELTSLESVLAVCRILSPLSSIWWAESYVSRM